MGDGNATTNNFNLSSTGFVYALDLSEHPMRRIDTFSRKQYYALLQYLTSSIADSAYTRERLMQYKNALGISETDQMQYPPEVMVRNICYQILVSENIILMHDLYYLTDEQNYRLLEQKLERLLVQTGLKFSNLSLLEKWKDTLFISSLRRKLCLEKIALQTQHNYLHQRKNEKRVIVTAPISAGKSTLINALIGKKLASTATGVCTGNIGYLYNKAFEDGRIHLLAKELSLNADSESIKKNNWSVPMHIASYFRSAYCNKSRICLIDTPGVNAVTHPEHGDLARCALLEEKYDICVCVVSENNYQTTDEFKHMQWLWEHVPEQKIVFAFNKLDNYHDEDNIDRNVENLRAILKKVGFTKPLVCPVSAKCALLEKLVTYEKEVSPEQKREYEDMLWKFDDPKYDLSRFYELPSVSINKDSLLAKCGFAAFENIIFGGA